MKKIYSIYILCFLYVSVNAQQYKCGFEYFEKMIQSDSALQKNVSEEQKRITEWINTSPESRKQKNNWFKPTEKPYEKDVSDISALCGYDNSYFGYGNAPTIVGNQLVAYDMEGGDYITVNNMIAGRTYVISTCGNTDFDTQITVYTQGGGYAVAHSDDACGTQSEIYFTPLISGNYDILLDEYPCDWTILVNTDVIVELNYIPRPIITIPVVYHVLYNNSSENISDAQIFSQMDVLNEHFMRLQPEIYNIPAAFRGQSCEPLFQFCLAQRDPDGNATNGIERTFVSAQDFNGGLDQFSYATGGQDPWDKSKYLNIWVCDMLGSETSGAIGIGFSAHPYISQLVGSYFSGIGVTVDYTTVGANGQFSGAEYGKNLVHEIGHWLGLWHTWGLGDSPQCATDSVFDTPFQDEPVFGQPSYPYLDACSPNYPGVMFHNYMNYADDIVKNMFTYGQTAVMDYAIFNWYQGIITSDGCNSVTVDVNENVFSDFTIYPNPSQGRFTIQANFTQPTDASIEIFNTLGELLKSIEIKQVRNSSNEINLDNAAGLYFVEIKTNQGSITKKIIIQ
jgi:hypothetical protein